LKTFEDEDTAMSNVNVKNEHSAVQQNVNDEEDFEFMTLDLPFFAV
jgi:hypothetical protein